MYSPAIDPQALAKARSARLKETLKELQTYGKRASGPADKVAFAELEEELNGVRKRWIAAGLLPDVEQQELLGTGG